MNKRWFEVMNKDKKIMTNEKLKLAANLADKNLYLNKCSTNHHTILNNEIKR